MNHFLGGVRVGGTFSHRCCKTSIRGFILLGFQPINCWIMWYLVFHKFFPLSIMFLRFSLALGWGSWNSFSLLERVSGCSQGTVYDPFLLIRMSAWVPGFCRDKWCHSKNMLSYLLISCHLFLQDLCSGWYFKIPEWLNGFHCIRGMGGTVVALILHSCQSQTPLSQRSSVWFDRHFLVGVMPRIFPLVEN